MKYLRPQSLLAGFHADSPDDGVPELVHAGEQWAPTSLLIHAHSHPVWEFYLQLEGTTLWSDDRRTHHLRGGGFFAAPPRVRHRMRDRPRARHHFFFAAIDLDAVFARHPLLRPSWLFRECAHLPNAHSLQPAFRQLIHEVSTDRPFRSHGLRIALDYLVVEATRLFEGGGRAILPLHPAVEQTRALLDRDFAEPWRLAELARIADISPNHLVQLFTREMGVSPHRHLLRRRIERAKELLRDSDIKITRMALDLGFSSSQHFAKTFRQHEHCSAADYRRRARHRPAPERAPAPKVDQL